MSRFVAHSLLMLTAFIWGITFIFQTTGMQDGLGPIAFNAFRFLASAFALLPFALIEARKNPLVSFIASPEAESRRYFFWGILALGGSMFAGSILQQVSLGITSVANAAFLTTLYVPLVPLLALVMFGRNMVGWRWLAVAVFLAGSWMMSGASPKEAVAGDIIVVIGALFWAFHIMLVGGLVKRSSAPFQLALSQTLITMVLSFAILGLFETFTLEDVLNVWPELVFAGVMSTAFGFGLQLVAQQHCSNAAAAIILSLEGVIAAIAGWILLGQSMENSAILGAGFIFFAILLVELTPEYQKP